MKDYTLKEEDKNSFITKIKVTKNDNNEECLELKFADGSKFKNIIASEENIAKIQEKLNEQAKKGIANKVKFKNKISSYGKYAIIGALYSGLAIPNVLMRMEVGDTSPVRAVVTGLAVSATAYSFFKYINNKGIVAELNKIETNFDNIETLNSINDYENSLAGLSEKKKNYFKNTNKPFSIFNIDNYTNDDLEVILSNINKEKEYSFDYQTNQNKQKQLEKK